MLVGSDRSVAAILPRTQELQALNVWPRKEKLSILPGFEPVSLALLRHARDRFRKFSDLEVKARVTVVVFKQNLALKCA